MKGHQQLIFSPRGAENISISEYYNIFLKLGLSRVQLVNNKNGEKTNKIQSVKLEQGHSY